MFFIFGISTKEKELDFSQTTICPSCGAYGRLEAFMTYTFFSLFFIPLFKWNKKYYIRSTCCGGLYTIDDDLGKAMERGERSSIKESDLNPVNTGHNREKYCPSCNFPMEPGFEYCPKCGNKQ